MRVLLWIATNTFYKVKIDGLENIPKKGPALLVCNHVSYIDVLLINSVINRPVKFYVLKAFYDLPIVNYLIKTFCKIPLDFRKGSSIIQSNAEALEALKNNELVLIFPEGKLSLTGNLGKFRKFAKDIIENTEASIVPLYIDNVWGSIFSYDRKKVFWKIPKSLPQNVTVNVGEALRARSKMHKVFSSMRDLNYRAFQKRKPLTKTLVESFIEASKKSWLKKAVSDLDGKKLTYGQLLSVCFLFSKVLYKIIHRGQNELEAELAKPAVGIVLPSGIGALLANLASSLAGIVPVNLNFTSSEESLKYSVEKCKIKYLITSDRFLDKINLKLDFLENCEILKIEDLLKQNINKIQVLCWSLFLGLFPESLVRKIVSKNTDTAEGVATVLFSSGSTGVPKGIMLSHKNIQANVEALDQILNASPQDCITGILPFFHSFGFTCNIWLPLVKGASVAYHVSPLDARNIGKLVEKEKCTIMVATPTFLSLYHSRIKAEQFSSLRLAIVGAEKLKPEFAKEFEDKYRLKVFEGYGATELSPVAAVNVDNVSIARTVHQGVKSGTVGQAIPGVSVRVTKHQDDMESYDQPSEDRELEPGEVGMLWISSAGLMKGYLRDQEKTQKAIVDGWYKTGDLASVDEEGFITIHGRLSRFSKIAGEMVPHEKVEEILQNYLQNEDLIVNKLEQIEDADVSKIAVTSIEDKAKGEKLAVVYSGDVDVDKLYDALKSANLPNLWVPSKDSFYKVKEIPFLGSGKLDLVKLKSVAQENAIKS